MGNYNAIVGITEENVNRLSNELFQNLYQTTEIFKATKIFDKLLLYSVSYDVKSAPVFNFIPSTEAIDHLHELAKTIINDAGCLNELKKYVCDSAVTFSVDIPSIEVSAVLKKGEAPIANLAASLTLQCQVEIDAQGMVIPAILTANCKVPAHAVIEELLNKFALPVIMTIVNTFVEKGFKLPLIDFAGTEMSSPLARIENRTLIAYAALKKTGATVLPLEHTWSRNVAFALFDKQIAESATAYALQNTQKTGTAEIGVPIFWSTLKLSATYIGGVKDPVYTFLDPMNSDISITAYGGGTLTAQLDKLPAISLSFTASATPTARSVLFLSNNQLFYTLNGIDDFKVNINVDFSLIWVPQFIKDAINNSISFLFKPFAILIGGILKNLTIKITDIKPVQFTIAGQTVTILLENCAIASEVGPDQKILAKIAGMLTAKK